MTPVIQTRALAKRYRRVRALSECTITVPDGRISALIGPNGAGKTTLLRLLSGLAKPTGGEVAVLGGTPRQDPAFLAEIGYLAQEIPLYRRFTAEDHIGIGAHLNPRWDAGSVRDRLRSLNIPLDRAAGTLSGGQRAQLALALTLAKKPRLLLLDEPVAALDPLARRHFLGHLGRSGRRRGPDCRAVLAPARRPGTGRRPPDLASRVPGPAVRRHRRVAGRAPCPGRPAQGHHGDREDPHRRAGCAHRPPDHLARPRERPGDRPGLGEHTRSGWKKWCSATWARTPRRPSRT